jgi:hypothetical protein
MSVSTPQARLMSRDPNSEMAVQQQQCGSQCRWAEMCPCVSCLTDHIMYAVKGFGGKK